jgi:hypothetical protein
MVAIVNQLIMVHFAHVSPATIKINLVNVPAAVWRGVSIVPPSIIVYNVSQKMVTI